MSPSVTHKSKTKCRVNNFFVYSRNVCGGQCCVWPGIPRSPGLVAWDRERDTCRQRRVINRTRKSSRRCATEIMILRHVHLELEPFMTERFCETNSLTPYSSANFLIHNNKTFCKISMSFHILDINDDDINVISDNNKVP